MAGGCPRKGDEHLQLEDLAGCVQLLETHSKCRNCKSQLVRGLAQNGGRERVCNARNTCICLEYGHRILCAPSPAQHAILSIGRFGQAAIEDLRSEDALSLTESMCFMLRNPLTRDRNLEEALRVLTALCASETKSAPLCAARTVGALCEKLGTSGADAATACKLVEVLVKIVHQPTARVRAHRVVGNHFGKV